MKSEKKYEKLPNETFDEYLDRVSTAAKPKPPEWPKALAQQRWEQRQRELDAEARQDAIDAVWKRTLMEKRLQAEEPSPERKLYDELWGVVRRNEERVNREKLQTGLTFRARIVEDD
ncbi:MAG: hypothetical protein WA322_01850 [Pseudolabrys sp.]